MIDKYRAWAKNKDADLINPANGSVEGIFPPDFFKATERYVPLRTILGKVNSEDTIINMDMGMVPDLVTRLLLLDAHSLNPAIIEMALPARVQVGLYDLKGASWVDVLSRCQDDGLRSFRITALYFAEQVSEDKRI